MSVTKKKNSKKTLKKMGDVVVVIERHFDARDTLFPEKVAKGNEMLKNLKIDEIDWSRKA